VRKISLAWCELPEKAGRPAGWGLAVQAQVFLEDGVRSEYVRDDGDPVPVLEVEPEARVMAWTKLPELLQALDKRAGELIGLSRERP
jgi:hypothetical protein